MESESELDRVLNTDYLENSFTSLDGFKLGYYIDEGKVKKHFSIGGDYNRRTEYLNNFNILRRHLNWESKKLKR